MDWIETHPGPITRQPDLRPQDYFQGGLVEDLFADLHLSRPIHACQDRGIPWEESVEALPTSALPQGPTEWHLAGPGYSTSPPLQANVGSDSEYSLHLSASTSSSVKRG